MALVNCFHLSIPFWTVIFPPLVDVAPTTAAPDKRLSLVTEKREASVTKEKGERGYPKYEQERLARNKDRIAVVLASY